VEALNQFRSELNALDERLLQLIGERFRICRAVAQFKRDNAIPMMQPARVAEVKERCAKLAASYDVDPDFARRLLGSIIDEACRLEDAIIDRAGARTGRGTA
jgi:chorismate mutase-like protein